MSEQQKHFPEFYVTAPQPCPYLAGRLERKLFTHLTHDKPPALVDNLLKGGFRRSQNIAYMPYCEGCQACVSVRVLVDEFEPKRSFRRVLDANRDIVARRLQATPTSEQYSLFRGYIDARHADGGMADMTVLDYAMMVEDSIIDTFVTEYRLSPIRPPRRRRQAAAARALPCAIACRTASRWSTASTSRRRAVAGSART
jgi:arginine-tRNA-protein transferase